MRGEEALLTFIADTPDVPKAMDLEDLTIVLHDRAISHWNTGWHVYGKLTLSRAWIYAFSTLNKIVLKEESSEMTLDPHMRRWLEGLRDEHLLRIERRATTRSASKITSWRLNRENVFVPVEMHV